MLTWCVLVRYHSIHRNEANLMRYDEHHPFPLHFCFDIRWFNLFITNFFIIRAHFWHFVRRQLKCGVVWCLDWFSPKSIQISISEQEFIVLRQSWKYVKFFSVDFYENESEYQKSWPFWSFPWNSLWSRWHNDDWQ